MPRQISRRAALGAAGLLIAPLSVAAQATSTADAAAFIEAVGGEALSLIAADRLTGSASVDRFRRLFNRAVDVPYVARFVLGRFWNTANAEQQAEFVRLFEAWVVAIYADRFRAYAGERFSVVAARADGARDAIVSTDIERPGGPAIRVEWRVRTQDATMRVIDVAIANISMTRTQREEFESVILRGGGRIEVLLDDLRRRARLATASGE
jgi:phospholipid transport system substrate-binding protein